MAHPRKRDKVRQLFGLRPRTPQPPATSSVSISTSLQPQLQPQSDAEKPSIHGNRFVKGENLQNDMAVLSIAFVLQENPELKKLIQLIIEIRNTDSEDQFMAVLEKCARFGVQLASVSDAHQAEAGQSITALTKIVEQLQNVRSDGDQKSIDELLCTINKDIDGIKPSFIGDGGGGAGETLSKVLDVTIGPTLDILNLVKSAGGLIPVPYVQPLIGTVVNILQAVSQTRANYKEMRQIAATAGNFVVSCAVVCAESSLGPTLEKSLKKFNNTLRSIAEECEKLRQISLISRYLQQSGHVGKLQEIAKRLDNAIKLFQTENSINLKLDTEELNRKMDFASLNNLPSHPRYTRNEYLEKSRDDVLECLSEWITNAPEHVLWVHGAAGLGKSTVAQELVYLLKSEDRLAGGVFLTNLTMEAPETVVQMIARQLGEMYPRTIVSIAEATRKRQGPHTSLQDYFKSYILDPILVLKYPYQLVIVVDGLDEWRNYESFLAELVRIPSPSPLKFILTSRFDYSIERAVSKISHHTYTLPPASQQVIERYFHHHFSSEEINWRGRAPDGAKISLLAARADGLLIWAATTRSLIMNKFAHRYPHEILDEILLSEEKVLKQEHGTENAQLQRLYRSTIFALFPPHIRGELRKFLAASLVLQEPVLIANFSRLSGLSEPATEEIHHRLAALQTQGDPKGNFVSPAMQRFHASFVEFIKTDSDDQPFKAIDVGEAHTTLANKCLDILFLEFLPSFRGKTCLYSDLRGIQLYTVKFWPLHFTNGNMGDASALDNISDEAMHRWATLFLPSISPTLRDVQIPLDGVERCALLCEIAIMIGNEDVTTLPYQIHCLKVATQFDSLELGTRIWKVLGLAYNKLYQQSQLISDLDEAITAFRFGVEPSPHADRPRSLYSLGDALYTRFEHWGAFSDLVEAISLFQETLDLWPAPHPDRLMSLNSLASALLIRFEQQGSPGDLDRAITLLKEIPRPSPHPHYASSLTNLAGAFQTRFELRGNMDDLNEGILLYQEALPLLPIGHSNRSNLLNNLANALHIRFQQTCSSQDLDDAISFHREAITLRPAPHPHRSSSLNNLASALEQTGDPKDLDEAILFHREALFLRPVPHPERSGSLNNLASALQTRFEQWTTVPQDLDEAISLYQDALLLRSPPHPLRSKSLNNLASALLTRFGQRGDSDDLDEAIFLFRETVSLFPEPHPLRYKVLSNLANAIQSRFNTQERAPQDLDECISLNQEAVLLIQDQPQHPMYSTLLRHLAVVLRVRFDRDHLPQDLIEVVQLYEQLGDCPTDDPNRSWSLEHLPAALQELDSLLATHIDVRVVETIDSDQSSLVSSEILDAENRASVDAGETS